MKKSRYEKTGNKGIYKLGEGRYEIRVPLGKREDGSYRPHRDYFEGSLTEAKNRRAELVCKRATNTLGPSSSILVKDFLKEWLETDVRDKALKTREWYQMHVRQNINPFIGNHRVKNVTPVVIAKLYKDLQSNGKSDFIRSGVHRTLNRAFNWGREMNIIAWNNPLETIKQPKIAKREKECLSAEEVVRFIDASKSVAPELTNLFIVMVLTGIRKGEAFGLRWSDVDFKGAAIHIRQQLLKDGLNPVFAATKTSGSNRVIDLSDAALKALHDEKQQQEKYRAQNPDYRDYGLVFCQADGGPLPHKPTYKKLHACRKAASIEKSFSYHALRHTFVTLSLENGTPIKAVSEISGHQQTSTTLNMYAHAARESRKEAVKDLDVSIFGDSNNANAS